MKLTTKAGYIPDIFRLQLTSCQLVMMWPIKVKNVFHVYLVRFYFCFLTITLGFGSVGLLLKAATSRNLVDRSEAIDIMTLTSSALYKLIFFAYYHKDIKWLVMKCVEFYIHLPKGWLSWTNIFSLIHSLAGFFFIGMWGICPMLNVLFGVISLEEMPLPINVYIQETSGWLFALLYFLSLVCLVGSTHVYMAADTFLFTTLHMTNGILETLSERLTTMEDRIPLDNVKIDLRHEYLKSWIKLHNEVMEFIRKLDVIIRSMIVADVLHAIISLSFAMLQTSESKGFLEWIKCSVFTFYCFVHQYLNSHFGQKLIDKQEAIFLSTHDIPWVESSMVMKKSVLQIANGTLRPVRLSAWRMYFLQYATFMEFVKTIISTFMVLHQLQDEAKKIST